VDDGPGIPERELQKIYDPFFGTKVERSGLGLSISSTLINNHNGRLQVISRAEEGTRVNIYLPALGNHG